MILPHGSIFKVTLLLHEYYSATSVTTCKMKFMITACFIFLLITLTLGDDYEDTGVDEGEDDYEDPLEDDVIHFDELVVVLSQENFTTFIGKNDYVLVEFYAPWCGHCKRLAPQYAKAAKTLADVKSSIKLAKVDATQAKSLANDYKVTSYPTLQYFRNGIPISYSGERSPNGIVDWVNKKMGPPATDFKELAKAKAFIEEHDVVVMGYFKDQSSADAKIFLEVAATTGNLYFGITSDETIFEEFSAKNGAIFMYKKFDDPKVRFKGDLNLENLKQFLSLESMPLLDVISPERLSISGGKYYLLLLVDKTSEETTRIEDSTRLAAKHFKGKISFNIVDSSVEDNDYIFDFIKADKEEVPTIRIIKLEEGNEISRFKPKDTSFTVGVIKTFVQDFLDNKLEKYLLRQKLPENWDKEDVVTLVADNFESVVLDVTKDVLVEFYSPKSTHCIEIEGVYEEVGRHFKDKSDVIIAKLDVTANEMEHIIAIETFPTFKLYRKGDNKIIEYGGPRRFKGISRFVTSSGREGATVQKPEDEDENDFRSMKDEL